MVGYPDGVFNVTCRIEETTLGKATWKTEGRGFGRRTGWLVPNDGFFVTSAYSGRRPVPGSGAVKIDDQRMLDLRTGNIYVQKEECIRRERVT